MQILLVEDDIEAAGHLSHGLREAGYAVTHCADGAAGLAEARATRYELLIVDRMLPNLDGLSLVGALRKEGVSTPVLVLSALGTIDDRVEGLRAGGDDYLVKPFAFAELLARVRALLRRGPGSAPLLVVGDLELDPLARRVSRAQIEIRLTAKEFAVLEYLMRNAGRVVTKTMIADHVWNFELDSETNFIEVFIYTLRKKVDAPFEAPLIHTVRGSGYRIEATHPTS